MVTISNSIEQTERLGYIFAEGLCGNETICLMGDVGGGKSSFVRGMLKYLFPNDIYKPTYRQSICIYHDKLLHIDGSNFLKIGLPDEFVKFNGIRVIEHGDLWENELIFDHKIKITRITKINREVEVLW